MREDLLKSAVSFLSDPKVQSSPLAKKVSFLESKGMTAEEVEEALSRASGKSTTPATPSASFNGMTTAPSGVVMHAPPPLPARRAYDWRDVFIAAVLAGGVGYGVWTLAKNVFGPWFKVPTQKELDDEKAKLDEQFQSVEDALKEIKEQSSEALSSVSRQSQRIDDSLGNLDTVLTSLKESDAVRDQDFKNVKGDVESLKDLVQKMVDRNKEAQSASLTDLQNEMKSLKSLLLSRRSTATSAPMLDQTTGNTNASPADGMATPRMAETSGRPSIPAWQLAINSKSTDKAADTTKEPAVPIVDSSSSAPSTSTTTPPPVEGKS